MHDQFVHMNIQLGRISSFMATSLLRLSLRVLVGHVGPLFLLHGFIAFMFDRAAPLLPLL